MSISQQQVEQMLAATVSGNEAEVRSSAAALESAESFSSFPFILAGLALRASDEGCRVAAATYLKNLLRKQWHLNDFLASNERLALRNQIIEELLQADPAVMKVLVEAFSVIINNDFVHVNSWPELVPAMKSVLQASTSSDVTKVHGLKTLNILVAVHAMMKPFRYFMKPTVAKEPVPEQLELICHELLSPFVQMFDLLVQEMNRTREQCVSMVDHLVLLTCKCFHLAVWSHMPNSLLTDFGKWCNGFFTVIETIQVECKLEKTEHVPRMKAWKRVLQIFCTLVNRHRKYIDKMLPKLATTLLEIAKRGAVAKDVHPIQERVISSAFDAISNILETGPGWRLISSHFSSLLEGSIFPALTLKEKDIYDWKEDQEEYLRKNLPSDMDNTTGWRDDLYTPRRSALNLLGLISTSKGPPIASARKASAVKRKKRGKCGSAKEVHGTAGDLLVVPFLSQFPLPPDGCAIASELVINYYGALLAYGGLQQFLKTQRPEHLCMLLRSRVLPLYSMASPCPLLLANANWLLGELASCLPEDMNKEVYDALLKAFLAPNSGNLTWRPVRQSAAAALSAALEEEYKPKDWLPLLQAAVSGSRAAENDEGSIALQLLGTIAETGGEDIVSHVPAIIPVVQVELQKRILRNHEAWPQIMESGFSAFAALAQAWQNVALDDDDDDYVEDGLTMVRWKEGCVTISNSVSELLQQAWLGNSMVKSVVELSPPPSCLNDASVLLSLLVAYTTSIDLVAKWKIEELLQVWADLIADWNAWDEEEDLSVFEAIKQTISLQERLQLPHFAAAAIPPPPALPVRPRSILEGITAFTTLAIETAYPSATWRACRLCHKLLHISALSFESDEITPALVIRFTQAAVQRFTQLSSLKVPLVKPLVLLIAACYACSSELVVKVVSESENKGVLLLWGEALGDLALSTDGLVLALESELILAVTAMLKILNEGYQSYISHDSKMSALQHKFFRALLTCSIKLAELHSNAVEDECYKDETEEESEEDGDGSEDDEDDEDDDSEDDEQMEETEEQFLQRYARKAQELEKDVLEEAEGGEDEDGEELDLGILQLKDYKGALYSFLETHAKRMVNGNAASPGLVDDFLDHLPDARRFFE